MSAQVSQGLPHGPVESVGPERTNGLDGSRGSETQVKKVLIANRGEIAVRVATTLRAMGIQSVAVYSEADASAAHVRACDEAVLIGPPAPRESYLVVDKILGAAKATDADAIHPGYGFLSENAAFAESVAAAGLTWIGPPPSAIVAMGSKIASREKMIAAGVPVVPGYNAEEGQDLESLTAAARRIGFPVLVKATAGGGGKGMRSVESEAEFAENVALAQREALAAFGDGTVYLEKLLVRPRHVEIQIFGDRFGHVVHLGERECSIQRRHQKVYEESPSPVLSERLRRAMGLAAVKAGEAVDYVGAGTVEFMLVGEGEKASFFFLEMNTRLQVEHPVTELVTGLDLVRLQVEVAQGRSLPELLGSLPTRDEHGVDPAVPLRGHAIEVRLYAEDPQNGFMPSTGTLIRYRLPHQPGVRLDTGFAEGDEVSVFYDPMLAKLIAYGDTREHATRRLLGALERWEVLGVTTNLELLREIGLHPAFIRGETHTGFIAEHWPEGFVAEPPPELVWLALAVDPLVPSRLGNAAGSTSGPGPGKSDPVATWRRVGSSFGGVR